MALADRHERTEKPTDKRRREARKDGKVARSPDVSGWGAAVLASFLLPWYFHSTEAKVLGIVGQTQGVMASPSTAGALRVLEAGLGVVLTSAAPIGGLFALFAIVANIAQTGRGASFAAARPKLSRLSPKTGIKRLFSANTAIQLLKQILKLLVLSLFAQSVIGSLAREMSAKQPVSLIPILAASASSVLGFVRVLSLLGLLIGLADFAYQRHQLQQSLKMTKQEVKDERRSTDGDPFMKGQLRKRQYGIARSRTLAAVKRADVVLTNPTHYAVALRYESGKGAAPRVVAKAADLLAARVREEAARWSIPIVEDPPLARYLYAICETDEQIPSEIYLAVAKVLAFVYGLPELVRGVGVHHVPPSAIPVEPALLASLSETRRERVQAVLAGAGR